MEKLSELLQTLQSENLLVRGDFVGARDRLDANYFDAEENGDIDKAAKYFVLARLCAALFFLQNGSRLYDLSEAVYEAGMASANPEKLFTDLANSITFGRKN